MVSHQGKVYCNLRDGLIFRTQFPTTVGEILHFVPVWLRPPFGTRVTLRFGVDIPSSFIGRPAALSVRASAAGPPLDGLPGEGLRAAARRATGRSWLCRAGLSCRILSPGGSGISLAFGAKVTAGPSFPFPAPVLRRWLLFFFDGVTKAASPSPPSPYLFPPGRCIWLRSFCARSSALAAPRDSAGVLRPTAVGRSS